MRTFTVFCNHMVEIITSFADFNWIGAGPLFFYTGNEGPIDEFMNNTGFMFTLARRFAALVVFAEHVSVL